MLVITLPQFATILLMPVYPMAPGQAAGQRQGQGRHSPGHKHKQVGGGGGGTEPGLVEAWGQRPLAAPLLLRRHALWFACERVPVSHCSCCKALW